jgi:hypothetical protein
MLEQILLVLEMEKLQFVALLWSWRSERNRENHGERYQTIDQIYFAVRRHADECKRLFAKERSKCAPRCVDGGHHLKTL